MAMMAFLERLYELKLSFYISSPTCRYIQIFFIKWYVLYTSSVRVDWYLIQWEIWLTTNRKYTKCKDLNNKHSNYVICLENA